MKKNADFPNLTWEVNGEEINHQWGKSFEAEQLISNYIQSFKHYFRV